MRRALLVASVALLGACSTVQMDRGEIADVAADALASADLAATEIEPAAEPVDTLWPVSATVQDLPVELSISRTSGRVTAVDLAEGIEVSDAQLERLASFEDNPAQDSANVRRGVIFSLLVVAAILGFFAWARRARLRDETFQGRK